jgi:RNA polymerase sigma-70 factor (ECF subfamily)
VHEATLIANARAGDPAAERALYDRHVDRVWRVIYRMVGDADHAADCVQDTFVKVFSRLGDFRGESALGTWIGAIAVSAALNKLRTLKREAARTQPIEAAESIGVTPREADPDLKLRLASAIDALPNGYRTVFVMHDMEGYTHEEIAATLGVQPGTSKAQLFRARGRLRAMLAPFAPSPS